MPANLQEIRNAAGTLSVMAAICIEDVEISIQLPDGRVLAPTTAQDDLERLRLAKEDLLDLFDA